MNNAANNTLKQIIVRHAPLSDKIVVVMADTRKNGQVDIYSEGTIKTVGYDYYQHTQPVSIEDAKRVAQEFARANGMDEESVILRQRFPKQVAKRAHNRRTNDAALTLVPSDNNGKQTLAKAAQTLHDSETRKADGKVKEATGQSTTANPEGATVKRTDAEKTRTKRAYNRVAGRNKKSEAAMKRYLAELQGVQAKQPELTEAPAPTASQEEIDEQTLKLAKALAKLMKDVL